MYWNYRESISLLDLKLCPLQSSRLSLIIRISEHPLSEISLCMHFICTYSVNMKIATV